MNRLFAIASILVILSACTSAAPIAPAPTSTRRPTVTPLGKQNANDVATQIAVAAETQAFLPTEIFVEATTPTITTATIAPPTKSTTTTAIPAETIASIATPTATPTVILSLPTAVPLAPGVSASPTNEATPAFTPSTTPVSIESPVWSSTGPSGANINVLAIDPVTPAILYAGTDRDGLFKSTNGGETWIAINEGMTDTQV